MQLISEEKINEIRNSADIVSIISDYIPLKTEGKNYFGICPFHDDHNPSMSVSKEKQLFKCFVCGKGGNVFTFVKDYENISFIEAVKKVADKVGIPLSIDYKRPSNTKYKKEYEIMELATKVFQNNLNSKDGEVAFEYLKKRGITEDIIKDFKIGYSLKNSKYLYEILSKKYDINDLDNLGLITKDGISGYDKFVDRVMIPLCNLEGNTVGFTGRIISNSKEAKYINTKETPIYVKGDLLFNYHNAKNYVREEKSLILVEGNMDAIRMYSSGIKNVCALMGTSITSKQINILKKLRVPIILMLDNDDAGYIATNNIGKMLVDENIEVKVVRLTDYKDPDEYILNNGIDKFKDLIKNSINYIDYRINTLKEDLNLNNTNELISYVKDVLKLLENSDSLTKEITLKKISDEYNIDYDILKKELNKEVKEDKKELKEEVKIKRNKYDMCVDLIMYYMMSDKKYILIFNKKLGYLKNKLERLLVSEIEYYIKKYDKINLADFISYSEANDNIKDYVNNIINNVKEDELSEKRFNEYISKINEILNKEERIELLKALKVETDINKQLELSKRLTELVKGSVKDGRD